MPRYKIILADDHEIFRQGLKSLVEKDPDFKIVGQAKGGEDLLALLKDVKCDIVVTDLSMPGGDGILAIKVIKEKYPKIKILVLTMQKDHSHFKHAMAAGASGYLLKDDAFEHFSAAVRMIMKGKAFVSASVSTLLTDRYIRSLDEVETPSLDILTKRELQILTLVAEGFPNKSIAVKLSLSVRTVETHRANLTDKLGIKTTAGIVKYALAKGLV